MKYRLFAAALFLPTLAAPAYAQSSVTMFGSIATGVTYANNVSGNLCSNGIGGDASD